MRIVFMGSPQPVVPVLESLLSNGHEVLAVYTPPDRPAGRGKSPQPPPLKEAALERGLPVVQINSLKDPRVIEGLASLGAEAAVLAAFGYLVPPALLEVFPFGWLNIHPSLLPKYRGAAPVAAAILAGDEFAGVSVMGLEAGLDSGPLFTQAQTPISDLDTTGALTARLFRLGGRMLLEVLAELAHGHLKPKAQALSGVSFAPELSKEAGKIDWHLSAEDIGRRVRAFQPWPGAYTRWQEKQIKILEARTAATAATASPGQIVILEGREKEGPRLGVGTGKGILTVLKIQMEGKRPLNGDEFLRGHKALAGAVLDQGG